MFPSYTIQKDTLLNNNYRKVKMSGKRKADTVRLDENRSSASSKNEKNCNVNDGRTEDLTSLNVFILLPKDMFPVIAVDIPEKKLSGQFIEDYQIPKSSEELVDDLISKILRTPIANYFKQSNQAFIYYFSGKKFIPSKKMFLIKNGSKSNLFLPESLLKLKLMQNILIFPSPRYHH
jgi:hypothetical protein